jgi:4-alpha-glucanotransferase
VLQFAFGTDVQAPDFQPHNFVRRAVVYTGTHDNDTTVGWFNDQGGEDSPRSPEQAQAERDGCLRYLGTEGSEIHWDMIRLALMSVADLAVFPLQDLLGLGSEARMNRPGTGSGNWNWRFNDGALKDAIAERLLRSPGRTGGHDIRAVWVEGVASRRGALSMKRGAMRKNSKEGLPSDPLWYKDAIIYEVRVRSYYDQNGDGLGDLAGLAEKLDYLQDLGVTALWLLPLCRRRSRDDGL